MSIVLHEANGVFRDWWSTEHAPIPETVRGEEFDRWGEEIRAAAEHVGWKLVDWVTEAKERGYEYEQIAKIVRKPIGSCRNFVKLGRAFPRVTRRYDLGPSYYDTVVAIKSEDDRETVLSQAIEQEYTRDEFRAFVSEYKRIRGLPDEKPAQPSWNNGNGGHFGDTAEEASTEPDHFENSVTTTVEAHERDFQASVCELGNGGIALLESELAKALARAEEAERQLQELREQTVVHLPEKTIEELRKRLAKYVSTRPECDWGISEYADHVLNYAWRPR